MAEERQGDGPAEDAGNELSRSLLARARSTAGSGSRPARSTTRRPTRRRRDSVGGYSGPGPDTRDPQPLGSTVDDLVQDRGWAEPIAVGGVEGRWGQIVGPEIAAHCVPEEFEAGRLVVRADSTAWATQVRLLSTTVLARLNDDLGAGTVTHLQVLGPRGPSWRKGRFRVKGRGPRDTYG